MTALLAFIAAMIGGSTDFGGGVAARSSSAIRVTAWVQSAGLVVLLAAVWFVDAPNVTRTDLIGGAVAGIAALVSFVLFYAALNRGQMSLLTPIVAIVGALTPVFVEITRGRTLAGWQIVGMVLAMVAVTLVVQRSPELAAHNTTPLSAIGLAALSGFGFSFFFLALGETSSDAGLWPLVVTRSVSGLTAVLAAHLFSGGVSMPDRKMSRLVVLSGVGDVIAMFLLMTALQRGPIAVATIVVSIYPVSTVVWARVILREQLQRIQWLGIGLVFVALPLIALA